MKRGKSPPAKQRYDAKHPVISARLSKKEKDTLYQYLTVRGISLADAIREMVGLKGSELVKVWKKAEKIGYDKGYEEGYEEAQQEIRNTVLSTYCPHCRATFKVVIGKIL